LTPTASAHHRRQDKFRYRPRAGRIRTSDQTVMNLRRAAAQNGE
jgi:hypothetical protein